MGIAPNAAIADYGITWVGSGSGDAGRLPSADQPNRLHLSDSVPVNIEYLKNWIVSGSSTNLTFELKNNTAEKPVNRIFEIIEVVRDTFGLPMEAMAGVCRVESKKTLYNWRDGVKPHKRTMHRLFDLNLIASAWRSAALPANETLTRMPVLQGESVLELLCKDELDKEKILFAGSRLAILAEQGQGKGDDLF